LKINNNNKIIKKEIEKSKNLIKKREYEPYKHKQQQRKHKRRGKKRGNYSSNKRLVDIIECECEI